MRQIEDEHQKALMNWAAIMCLRYPALKLLHHIPNGGMRHPAVAGKLKAMGAKAGVPDLSLPVPRGEFHGLYIELKKPATTGSRAGTTTPDQERWIKNLREQGYRVEVCFGWEAAAKVLIEYLA